MTTTDRDELVERVYRRLKAVTTLLKGDFCDRNGDWTSATLLVDFEQIRADRQADAATIADLVAALKQTVHLARAYSSGTGSIFEKAMADAERLADRAALKGGDHG